MPEMDHPETRERGYYIRDEDGDWITPQEYMRMTDRVEEQGVLLESVLDELSNTP